jgi:hypothetical protein
MKDAKGHGSDPRGKAIASAQAEANRTGKPMSVLNLNTVGRAMHVVRDYSPGHEQGMYAHQFVAKVEPQVSGGGQPVASNEHAAATLASGPKSSSVPVHSGASGRADAFYKDLESRQAGQTFPKHGYMPNDPGNRPGNKPTDL